MRRDTQNLLLILLGGALVKISATDIFLRYVKPGHRWWLLAAGIVIVVLALVSIVRDMVASRAPARNRHHHDGHHHDGHEHREPHSPWLLVLPVLAIFLIAPPALGAASVERAPSGNVLASPGPVSLPPLPAGEAPNLGLSTFVSRAVWNDSAELANRDVTLTGFVVRRGGSVELARMAIACCAADARPVTVRLVGPNVPDVPTDTWLRARVRWVPASGTAVERYVPSASVVAAVPIAAPTEPYEVLGDLSASGNQDELVSE